jgi:hypothetical protein
VLDDLKKVRRDDIDIGLERGKLLELKEVVIRALGG